MAQCLQDEDEDVREACSAVLASFPPSLGLIPFQEQLVRCAFRDRAPLVRVAAMRALASFPVENLVLMVSDGGACGGVCLREGLVKRLEDEGREMRLAVVRLLARLPMEALTSYSRVETKGGGGDGECAGGASAGFGPACWWVFRLSSCK